MARRMRRLVGALVVVLGALVSAAPAYAGFEDNHNEALAADEG